MLSVRFYYSFRTEFSISGDNTLYPKAMVDDVVRCAQSDDRTGFGLDDGVIN